MNRTEIIRSLNIEYQKGLPDIPKDSSGYLQESTTTLICFGNCVTKQPSEIRRAQMYFSQVQIELKKGVCRPEDLEKIEYCRIAENAITELLKNLKSKKGEKYEKKNFT